MVAGWPSPVSLVSGRLTVETPATANEARGAGWVDRLAAALAVAGGVLTCLAAALVTVSVLGQLCDNSSCKLQTFC